MSQRYAILFTIIYTPQWLASGRKVQPGDQLNAKFLCSFLGAYNIKYLLDRTEMRTRERQE